MKRYVLIDETDQNRPIEESDDLDEILGSLDSEMEYSPERSFSILDRHSDKNRTIRSVRRQPR